MGGAPVFTMQVYWPTFYQKLGNSYGYGTHNEKAREAFLRAGGKIIPGEPAWDVSHQYSGVKSPDAPITIQVAPPHWFKPYPGCLNVLYTGWEADVMRGDHVDHARWADLILVMSNYCKPIFEAQVGNGVPVEVCHLGVDTRVFTPKRRRFDPERELFRVLWIGAPNLRKGYRAIAEVAQSCYEARLPIEFYIKTTAVTEGVEQRGNVVFDTRRLTTRQLCKLYQRTHLFAFPTHGEGFGLPLAESLATATPAVFTDYTGHTDFATLRTGYPMLWEWVDADLVVKCKVPAVSSETLAAAMFYIMEHYPQASRKAWNAAQYMRANFTWGHTGKRLIDILTRFRAGQLQRAA